MGTTQLHNSHFTQKNLYAYKMENEHTIIEPPQIIEITEPPTKSNKTNPIKKLVDVCVDNPSYIFSYIFLFFGLLYWMENSDYSRYELNADIDEHDLRRHPFRTLYYLFLLFSLPLIVICISTGHWLPGIRSMVTKTMNLINMDVIIEQAESFIQTNPFKRLYKWCVDHPSYVFWYIFFFLGTLFWIQEFQHVDFDSYDWEYDTFDTLCYFVLLISLPVIIICIGTGYMCSGIRSTGIQIRDDLMGIKIMGQNSNDEPLYYKPEKNSTLPKHFWDDSISQKKFNVDDLA